MSHRIDTSKTTSPDEMYAALSARLGDMVPDFELRYKAEIAASINRLKADRGAVILGHNYMEAALFHSVCDYKGDSLELSRLAAEAPGDPIVFCGVRFMAETAKILSPERPCSCPPPRAAAPWPSPSRATTSGASRPSTPASRSSPT
jgi:quinolinate synthase